MADLTIPEVPETSRFGTAGIPEVPDLPMGIGNREGSGTDVAPGHVRAIARASLALPDRWDLMCTALADAGSTRAFIESLQHLPAVARTHTLPVIDGADDPGLRDIEHARIWTVLAGETVFGFRGRIQTSRAKRAAHASVTPKTTHGEGA